MKRDLEDRVVIVTGGTSGIGAATVREFADCGAHAVIVGRDNARGEAIVKEIEAKGRRAAFLQGSVSDSAFCDRVIEQTIERFGGLDFLVNNAGAIHRADAPQTTDAMWSESMAVNVNGTFWMCRAAIRAMQESGRGGAIVNVASDWGLRGGKGHVAYCTAKGAIVNMTRALALDHARDGIRVNVLCPGETRTPMLGGGLAARGFDPIAGFEELGVSLPIGRVSEPEEQARCIRFLASDDASFVTGAAMSVDGGATAG